MMRSHNWRLGVFALWVHRCGTQELNRRCFQRLPLDFVRDLLMLLRGSLAESARQGSLAAEYVQFGGTRKGAFSEALAVLWRVRQCRSGGFGQADSVRPRVGCWSACSMASWVRISLSSAS